MTVSLASSGSGAAPSPQACPWTCGTRKSSRSVTASKCGWKCMTTQTTPSQPWGWRSNGRMQVPGEREKSANARHECFVMDASVSVKTAETAELDDQEHG